MAVRKHVQKNGHTTYYGLFRGPDDRQLARECRTVKPVHQSVTTVLFPDEY